MEVLFKLRNLVGRRSSVDVAPIYLIDRSLPFRSALQASDFIKIDFSEQLSANFSTI